MYYLRRAYLISPWVGLVLVSQHLLETYNPPIEWHVLHEEALQVGLRFPIPLVVAQFLSTYDLSLT